MASSEANQYQPLVVMAKLKNVIPVVSPLSKEEAERIVKGIAALKS